jgi:hypothetical protein
MGKSFHTAGQTCVFLRKNGAGSRLISTSNPWDAGALETRFIECPFTRYRPIDRR